MPNYYLPGFRLGMPLADKDPCQWIVEDSDGLLKGDAVLSLVAGGFARVPLESETHGLRNAGAKPLRQQDTLRYAAPNSASTAERSETVRKL